MRAYLNKNFEKQYSKLPPKIKAQFKDRRDLLLVDPAHTLLNNHSVERTYPGSRSINVTGDYRAIFGWLHSPCTQGCGARMQSTTVCN